MKKTKIEWTDSTWNPVTGCYHGCSYCYARTLARRFGGCDSGSTYKPNITDWRRVDDNHMQRGEGSAARPMLFEVDRPLLLPSKLDKRKTEKYGRQIYENKKAPYPFDFEPTLYRYKLEEPQHWKKPQRIFVGSMTDLFGAWVPMDWKLDVLEACRKAPQHKYLFLTKDPLGYGLWPTEKHPDYEDRQYDDNMWLGCTFTGKEHLPGCENTGAMSIGTNNWYMNRMTSNLLPGGHKYLSIEPILCDITEVEDEREGGKLLEHFIHGDKPWPSTFEWVIVGAETGRRKNKVVPQKEWIDKLVDLCDRAGVPVFMKESLLPTMGEENMRRDFPEGLK